MFGVEGVSYPERDCIPSEDKLTYDNGYYVNVVAIYVDIVGSSKLLEGHKRPTVAKIYRDFISETVDVMRKKSKYITIQGDCVGAVFELTVEDNMDLLFDIAISIYVIQQELAKKYKKYNVEFATGIGMSYGRALMIKAGLKGAGINDILWIGDVVNQACHFCNEAGRNEHYNCNLIVSESVYTRLNSLNKICLGSTYIKDILCYVL